MALRALARHADTGGGNGIRTPGDLRHGGFQSCAAGIPRDATPSGDREPRPDVRQQVAARFASTSVKASSLRRCSREAR